VENQENKVERNVRMDNLSKTQSGTTNLEGWSKKKIGKNLVRAKGRLREDMKRTKGGHRGGR
jgi:hypothetical protein